MATASVTAEERQLQLIGQQALHISELEDALRLARSQSHEFAEATASLGQRCQTLENENALLLQKLQKARRKVMQWYAYTEKQKQRLATTSCEGDLPMPSTDEMMMSSANTAAQEPLPEGGAKNSDAPLSEASRPSRPLTSAHSRQSPVNGSSQSTMLEENVSTSLVTRHNGDDEQPEIVSERQLKRRRLNHDGARQTSPKIKSEPGLIELSSDVTPESAADQIPGFSTQLSDLNVIATEFKTPRLSRTRDVGAPRAISAEAAHSQPIPQPVILRHCSSLSDSCNLETYQKLENADTASARRSRRRIAASSPPRRTRQQRHAREPLQSISGNVQRRAHKSKDEERKARKKLEGTLALAEDDNIGSKKKSSVRLGNATARREEGLNNCSDLLNSPSRSRTILRRHSTEVKLEKVPKVQQVENEIGSCTAQLLASPASAPRRIEDKQINAAQSRSINIKSASDTSRPKTSLRSRPMESLKLDDFKFNHSSYGPTLQIADPIFKEGERMCPPNCSRPECCGDQMRKVLKIGGVQITRKTNREVLVEYLGPDYDKIMAIHGPEKRKDLIMQAHAMEWARRSGSRRQSGVRSSTPPGFWRTDMPSTQEVADDRDKADEIEKHKIMERWHEAMRPNGRWRFRDECES